MFIYKPIILFAGIVGLALLAGCAGTDYRSHQGTIIEPSLVGQYAPNLTFKDVDGKTHMMSTFMEDASIIAFTDQDCSQLSEKLVDLSNRLKNKVAVIEICVHPESGSCKNHDECVRIRGKSARNLIALCDGKDIARERFKLPKSDSVILLDNRGIIRSVTSVNDLDRVEKQARQIAENMESNRESLYAGG